MSRKVGNMMESENTIKNISSAIKLKPGGKYHYGTINLSADGHFLFTGDFALEIDELNNSKGDFSKFKYEFLVQTPNGQDGNDGENGQDATATAKVDIVIHKLNHDIHIKSIGGNGGNGGDGLPGGSGGNGGDAADALGKGGVGANGGDGGKGGDSGSGAPAPEVAIQYLPSNDQSKVIVLAKDDTPCDDRISYGGEGGEGGNGGSGGEGGAGGKNGDGTYALPGDTGGLGGHGQKGTSRKDSTIKITLLK